MISYFVGQTNKPPSTSETNYISIHAAYPTTWSTSIAERETTIPHALTISNFQVTVETAPGAGTSYEYTILKNGVATALTATIADAATSAADTTNSVAFSAGDTIALRTIPTGTPTASFITAWNVKQEAANLFAVVGGTTVNPINMDGEIQYNNLQGSGSWVSTTEDARYSPMPTAGTFNNLYVKLSPAPGTGESYQFSLMKNGVVTGLSVTIAGSATTANDTASPITVAAGDTVSIRCFVSGSDQPPQVIPGWSMSFDPDVDGESFLLFAHAGGPSALNTNWQQFLGTGNSTWLAVERHLRLGAVTLKSFYVLLTVAPGAGTNYAFTIRKEAADTAAAVTISGTATSGNITGQNIAFNSNDRMSFRVVPTGTPLDTSVKASLLFAESSSPPPAEGMDRFFALFP